MRCCGLGVQNDSEWCADLSYVNVDILRVVWVMWDRLHGALAPRVSSMTDPQAEDLYGILGARSDADYAELKACYQSLARATHPDKQGGGSGGGGGEQFQRVQRAWRVLSDPAARAAYDRSATAARLSSVAVEDELQLSELDWREDLDAYWRDCRCGDGFVLPREQLTPGALLVQCDSCSLTIRVLVSPDGITGQ
ncbi:dnaJ homolog subfamily C member 24-like isoform X2 [Amphibalanus amphitrite]|uniref:dnaJ homolog subfamily C member 24-like isoform X2 n=1 Tax=Amphibalanus amphitrite TaxID=1232801 RepID=UPI001C9280F8|nr:dnaJ homolog subfamily C member 24-like isoform X2 [Amphibalanus amphitrite]